MTENSEEFSGVLENRDDFQDTLRERLDEAVLRSSVQARNKHLGRVAEDAIEYAGQLEARNNYPHMCRMGHPEIGHSFSDPSDERCPFCIVQAERDRAIDALEDLHDEAVGAHPEEGVSAGMVEETAWEALEQVERGDTEDPRPSIREWREHDLVAVNRDLWDRVKDGAIDRALANQEEGDDVE